MLPTDLLGLHRLRLGKRFAALPAAFPAALLLSRPVKINGLTDADWGSVCDLAVRRFVGARQWLREQRTLLSDSFVGEKILP